MTLTEYRKQRHLSIEKMAKEIGINPATLHRIEHNSGYHTIRLILSWCQSTGFNPTDVFPPNASA